MNPDKSSQQKRAKVLGFLALGVTWGFGIGYILADWASKSIGYNWYANPYPHYFDYTVRCFLIATVAGLIVGLIADISIRNNQLRQILIDYNLVALIVVIALYALMSPAMISVRE